MAALTAEDFADLVNTTDRAQNPHKMTDLMSDLRELEGVNHAFRAGHVDTVGAGTGDVLRVALNADDNARHVGYFSVDNVNQVDGTTKGFVPWRNSTTGYTYDVGQLAMNQAPAKLGPFLGLKKRQMWVGWYELMEKAIWGEPESSTDDTTPFGMRYWLTYNATEGFNGGNHTSFASGPGDIDASTYARWRNYTAQYTNITKPDLILKLRRAYRKVGFKSLDPSSALPSTASGPSRYGLYTDLESILTMEQIVEDQNDALGNDVAAKDGMVTFRRLPVVEVPYFTENLETPAPFVGIDWSTIRIMRLKGRWNVKSPVGVAPLQHNVVQGFVDSQWNIKCVNRRKNFLVAKSTWHGV